MRLATALMAFFLLGNTSALARSPAGSPSREFYHSSDGQSVHRPTQGGNPAFGRVTATCRDGTSSYSHHHRGTCFGHGGVAAWQ